MTLSARYFEARCLEALGRKDEAANIYAEVAEAGNPNPYREDARVTAASIFATRGKKLDALKQYEALANEAQKPALKAECAVRGGLIALELVQADKGKIDNAMAQRAAALFQKGRTLPEAGKFRAIAQVGFRRLQYQTGQYTQLLADYKKELDKLPEAAQAEVLLLAANSERQLGHPKEAEALYRQIIAKYPDREEAKDAAYQQLINVYNSDPSALSSAVDQFLATNPTNERADQAKLLKAEALYKQQNYTEAASMYGELRASELSPRLRAEAAYKLGLCHVQTKNIPGVIEAFTYYMQTFPDSPQMPAALAQRALAYEQSKNYSCCAHRSKHHPCQIPKGARARSGFAIEGFDSRATGQYERNGRHFSATPERIPQEFCRGAGAILHRENRVRSEGLQDGVDRAEHCAATEQGAVLQSRVRSDHSLSVLFERSACAHQRGEQFHGEQSERRACRRKFWSGSESNITTRKIFRPRKNI